MIGERPPEVEARERVGHWEADTMMGAGTKDCVVTLVERKTGWCSSTSSLNGRPTP